MWHPDDGFQKCAILNKAIQRATGDYLLFSDGDCIPRNTFVANHHRFARRDRFLSGGYFKLPMSISHSLTIDDIRSGRAFQWSYLRSQGLPWSKRCVRFIAGKYFGRAFEFLAPPPNLLGTATTVLAGKTTSCPSMDLMSE